MSCDSSCSLSEVAKDPLFGDLDLPDLGVLDTTFVLAYAISLSPSCFNTLTPGPVTPVLWKCSVKLLPAGRRALELLEISSLGGAGNSGTLELGRSGDRIRAPIRSISLTSSSSSSSSAK